MQLYRPQFHELRSQTPSIHISHTATNATATLTHIDGTSLANGLTGNVLRFTATSAQATTYTLADDVTMGNRTALSDNVTTTAIEAAQTTLSSAIKSAIGVSVITIA